MHIENLLFILLIAMAVLFRLLASKAGQAKKSSQDPDQRSMTRTRPVGRAPVESDEERIRRFLEALGQPTTSKPPPPVAPRTDIPPRPVAPVQPPSGQFAPPWKLTREERRKRKAIAKEAPPLERVERSGKISPPAITLAPTFEVHEGPLPPERPPSVKTPVEVYAAATRPIVKKEELKTDIATLLASKSGLRNAIILREIFGPPRSLQALDLL